MGFASPDYQQAREDLRRQVEPHAARMDQVYSVAESMFRAKGVKITKTRGLSEGTVTVIFLLLTKACKTFRAVHATCLEGCGQDAAILLRALFETTTAVLWILQRNSRHRARLYAAHEDQRLLVIVEEWAKTPGLKHSGKALLKKAQVKVDAWQGLVGPAALRSVRHHWSGERGGLQDAARKLKGWLRAYNTVYRATSAFAHGSDPTQHANFRKDIGTPVYKLLPGDDEVERSMAVSCVLLYAILKRMNDSMGLGLDLDPIKPEHPRKPGKIHTPLSQPPPGPVAAPEGAGRPPSESEQRRRFLRGDEVTEILRRERRLRTEAEESK